MLPVLAPESALGASCLAYLEALRKRGFQGDVDSRYATRLTAATDNSAFQLLPQAVLFPRSEDDIATALGLLHEAPYRDLYLAARGGGTSTIGCSLGEGLVLDCSRYMNAVLDIDPAARRVRVQPGVVLDQLNDALVEHGLFFAPTVAPSSRATLGGMANTDGCGKGSRIHGKTSDHVLETRLILADGSRFVAAELTTDELAELQTRNDLAGHIHREVATVVHENADEIARVYPHLSRYLSGYNLAQIVDSRTDAFNLNKLICGSEGTLAVVSELTLQLTPIPKAKTLFALRYDSFDAALRDAQRLVEFDPAAIETLDDKVMGLARDNPIYERVRDYIENADGSTPAAVNLVEFVAAHEQALETICAPLQSAFDASGSSGASGYYRATEKSAIAALWDLRKGGVGLLGSIKGDRKPLPFVEDTVVDPRNLADYVREFRALLDEYGLEYGMFGHIDVGCLHVRPALNLADPADERIMREITDRVAALAERHGGMIWNEHGKGFRSQYNPAYFGPVLYGALGEIKQAFDPYGQLNPGKIVAGTDSKVALASMSATTRGAFDRQIDPADRAAFPTTVACNGNGACFNYNPADIMCPSYRATRDRLHSPKGRAGVMREWLRQLAASNSSAVAALKHVDNGLWPTLLRDLKTAATGARWPNDTDFSHEVWQAMDGCLSCRACASQCPIKVDVPGFKTHFLALYHQRYARPLADYAIALLEPVAPVAARWPRLSNFWSAQHSIRRRLADLVGLSDLPSFSTPSMASWLAAHPKYSFSATRYHALSASEQARVVFIVPDVFTWCFDAPVVRALVELISKVGHIPLLAPLRASGKPLQVKGFLGAFERTAGQQAERLRQLAAFGRPLVGIDPSVTLMYREEYTQLAGDRAVPRVMLIEEWLASVLPGKARAAGLPARALPSITLLQHCTAAALSSASARAWQAIFEHFGIVLAHGAVGCCGMSGAYGHETRHRATSVDIFELSWADAIGREGIGQVAVPGYSCRSQIKRVMGVTARHPAQLLLERIDALPSA